MMILSTLPGKPAELLRSSSEQIRRAADLVFELVDETDLPALPGTSGGTAPADDTVWLRAEQTIRAAQRSFAATLRLEQQEEHP